MNAGRRLALAASLLAASLTLAPAARAAHAGVAHALAPEARTLYEQGRTFYAKGDYASALDCFSHAHDITPDPRLLWNMAACEHKLGHYVRMLRLVRDYLETGGALLTDADRRDASKLLATVRSQVASLALTTDPPGAEVDVDGDHVATTPLDEPLLVDPGEHEVRVSKAGYRDVTRSESFPRGEQLSWSFALQPVPPPPAPPPPAPPPPAPERPRSRLPLFVAGGGLLVAAGGGTTAALAAARYGSLHGQCAPSCDPSQWKTWQTLEPVGWVLVGVGGAAAAAGLVWELASPHRHSAASEAAVYVVPSVGGAVLGARF